MYPGQVFATARPGEGFVKCRNVAGDPLCTMASGARRVVQRQDGRLLEDAARAQARRVIRVAFHFGRTPFVGRDEETRRVPVKRHAGRIRAGDPGHGALWGRSVGHDPFARRACAPGPREHQRCSEELQEIATRAVLRRTVGGFRKLQRGVGIDATRELREASPRPPTSVVRVVHETPDPWQVLQLVGG